MNLGKLIYCTYAYEYKPLYVLFVLIIKNSSTTLHAVKVQSSATYMVSNLPGITSEIRPK